MWPNEEKLQNDENKMPCFDGDGLGAFGRHGRSVVVRTLSRKTIEGYGERFFHRLFQLAISQGRAFLRAWLRTRDVDTLRALPEGASVRINSMRFYKGDSVAVADVEARDFLEMDTIGKTGRWVEKARYLISARLVRGVWKVWLSAPLRAEKD